MTTLLLFIHWVPLSENPLMQLRQVFSSPEHVAHGLRHDANLPLLLPSTLGMRKNPDPAEEQKLGFVQRRHPVGQLVQVPALR